MKITTLTLCSALTIAGSITSGLLLWPPRASAVGSSNSPLPAVIEAGFDTWTKGVGVEVILSTWQRGGLMEGSNKVGAQASYFRTLSQALGNYRSHEVVLSKAIGRSSQVLYLSINFERGAVYGRFLLYRTDKDWVVQNMDFNARPEAIMPWLAFEGERAE